LCILISLSPNSVCDSCCCEQTYVGATNEIIPPVGKSFVDLCGGLNHFCARASSGNVTCWSNYENYFLLCRFVFVDRFLFFRGEPQASVNYPFTGNCTALACGTDHTCCRYSTGAVRCWCAPKSVLRFRYTTYSSFAGAQIPTAKVMHRLLERFLAWRPAIHGRALSTHQMT
jgi:hypothetical protein